VSLDDPERAEGPNVDYIHIDEARLVRHLNTAWLTSVRRLSALPCPEIKC
jgi:hypothetical protein